MQRRRFLTVAGATGVAGLSGCLGSDDGGDDGNETDDGPDNETDNGDENGGNGDENGNEDQLEAALDWSPEGPSVNERVTFDAAGSTGEVAEYRWDFTGDGDVDQTTTEATIQTSFGERGWQTVTLTVADGEGETAQTSADIPVGVTQDLSATFSWSPQTPSTGDVIVFSAAESTGSIVEFRWDIDGDGEFEETGAGTTLTHLVEEAGSFDVTLEVEAGNGETERVTRTVEVIEDGEAAFSYDPDDPVVGEVVTFDASASTVEAAEYSWDFDADGTFDETTTEPTITHSYEETGNNVVSLQIEASDGETFTANANVFVQEPDPGLQVQFEWSPRAPQPDEEVIFGAAASTEAIEEYRWDFDGDGQTDEVTDEPNISHTYNEEGVVTVRLEVEDAQGRTASMENEVDVGGSVDPGPDAMFRWEPVEVTVGEQVTFDATLSSGDIVEYRWDFDADGEVDETTTEPEATHTFDEPGITTVGIEIEDGEGRIDSHTVSFDVAPVESDGNSTDGQGTGQ